MPKKLRPTVDFMAFKCRTLRVKSTQLNEWSKTGWNAIHEGKIGRGYKEEMEKQSDAQAVHKEYG